MPHRRDGGEVILMRVREDRACVEHPLEAGVVLGGEARQIIGAELIRDNQHNEFGLRRRGGSARSRGRPFDRGYRTLCLGLQAVRAKSGC